MSKIDAHRPAMIMALLLVGALSTPLILSGYTLAAPLRATGSAMPTTIDVTQSVSFTCTPSGGTSPYTYSWAFGDGGTSALQDPSYAYNAAGTYTASVTVTDQVGGTDTWTSPTITVNTLPSVTGVAIPTTIDATQSVSFTCSPSNGTSPYTYLWDFADGSPGSTAQSASHIYASAGTYIVNVTVTDAVGEQAYWTVVVTVNALSTVTGTADPTTIDATQTVHFTCTPNYGTTPYSYSWAFGDGGTSALQNPSHIYTSEGLYTSNVTVTDAVGGQASWTVAITVNALPSVTGTAAPTTINSGQIVSFTCTPSFGTTPYTYSWDIGGAPGQFVDATTNQSQSPFYEFENPGLSIETYTATVTVTDAVGGQASWAVVITVNALPSVTGMATPTTIDSGQIVSFTCTADFGSGVYESYLWTFGDSPANTSTDQNTTHEYDEAGSYTVTVMVTDSLAERAIWTVNIIVNILPSVTGTATPTTMEFGQSVSFTCSPSGGTVPYTYFWTFGDGLTSTIQSPDHEYAAVGTYTVNLTVTDAANQTAMWSAVITVNSSASGDSLVKAAIVVGAIVAILAVIVVSLAARRKKKPANAVRESRSEDAPVPSIAVVKKPAPIEQPPVQEVVPVAEDPKETVKDGTRLPAKACPLCLHMNDATASVCKRCGTKLKFQLSRRHPSGNRPYGKT